MTKIEKEYECNSFIKFISTYNAKTINNYLFMWSPQKEKKTHTHTHTLQFIVFRFIIIEYNSLMDFGP
jgi:hypothetical protein